MKKLIGYSIVFIILIGGSLFIGRTTFNEYFLPVKIERPILFVLTLSVLIGIIFDDEIFRILKLKK